ncbi:hypothetical protein FOH10_06595 [Nocardia otitidiscaviarum]|uniref:Uncharacterized protein n=1 Tax=Nocardia otitidiscaviarum TaxID=1823 RepID=A0A516NHS3_9NOCA|nr:hypothetical protein [Nocardia otitidiscaviarum]MCP9620041.1 hypothetical protein [Nocardia otitidiscaviarum]QDP78458.1 hypothetical protein FOH10_06595 [Nocardia otitidiscaviarum]
MEITLLEDAQPDEKVTVRFRNKEWVATWRGKTAVPKGSICQVELEVEEIDTWRNIDAEAELSGAGTAHNQPTLCGLVSTVYTDGVIALDLDPGVVLIDSESLSEVQKGQRIQIVPHAVAIFPYSM